MMINTCQIVDVSVTEENRVKFKATEKLDKYFNFVREMLSDIKEDSFIYCRWKDDKEHRKKEQYYGDGEGKIVTIQRPVILRKVLEY